MDNNNNIIVLNIRDNSFDVISLIAALDVAFAHTLAHVLGGVWSNI